MMKIKLNKSIKFQINKLQNVRSVTDPGYLENPKCGICDCDVLYYEDWEKYSQDDKDKEYLALGSSETGIILCKHCLIQ